MTDHYRDLFHRHQWLEDGLCWTVVQPLDPEPGVDDLLWRLNGGRDPAQEDVSYPSEVAMEADSPVLLVFEGDGAWGFLSLSLGYTTPDHILTALSRESRVWMTSWHFNGGETVVYAAEGKIRARVRGFVFGGPPIGEGDAGILEGFRTMLDGLDPQDFSGKRSAPFAFIEAATGVGVESAQLDAEEASVVFLDNPDA